MKDYSFSSVRLARTLGLPLCWAAVLAIGLPVSEAAPQPRNAKNEDATLTLELLADFHSVDQEVARKALAKHDEKYRASLSKYQKESQATGNLTAVLAVQAALDDLDASRPPVLSDDPPLAALQKTHVSQRRILEAESQKASTRIDQDYLADLTKIVKQYTKGGQIENAMTAQARLDELTAKMKNRGGAAGAGESVADIDTWKKRAAEEFPALANPQSELSLKVKARVKELTAADPAFFSNPKWPYAITQECASRLASDKLAAETAAAAKNDPDAGKSLKDLLSSRPWRWYAGPVTGSVYGTIRFAESGAISGISWLTRWEAIDESSFKVFLQNSSEKYWVFKLAKNRKTAETVPSKGTLKDDKTLKREEG